MTIEAKNMVREAAREAADEAVQILSKDVDLKFAHQEIVMRDVISESIDRSLGKYLGMSSADHIRSHQQADSLAEEMTETKRQLRNAVIGLFLTGFVVTGANGVALKKWVNAEPTVIYVKKEEENESDRQLHDE